jgi:precorrin-6A/cobalt-precorrin-6A reductase
MPDRRLASKRLLILGGTAEARALAELAVARYGARLDVITSLAGRTMTPAKTAGAQRRGGFGGAAGLARYLAAERIDALVDATHPFAAAISANARAAAATARVPRLMLVRPQWRRPKAARWIAVDDAAAAAAAVQPLGQRIWLTFGGRELAAFAPLAGKWFLVRRIERSAEPLPLANCVLVLGRGPFTIEHERRLLEAHRIDALVCKASGGPMAEKLSAARAAGIPVVMIRRPPQPPGERVRTPAAALAWLAGQLGLDGG